MNFNGICIKNLRKSFSPPTFVLDIKSVEFHAGQLTCVVGPTGCGKTTLLNILAGTDTDFEGEVRFSPFLESRVSYQPQKDLLLPWKTVRDNLLFGFLATDQEPPPELASHWLAAL